MPTGGPLDFYNYPYTNSFVNNHPEVRFADPRIAEFCNLFPKKTNKIRKNILHDFLLITMNRIFLV